MTVKIQTPDRCKIQTMTASESAKQAKKKLGPAPQRNNGALNEYNLIETMNGTERIEQIIEDCSWSDSIHLSPDRRAKYEDACNTGGCNKLKESATIAWRISLRTYSHQSEDFKYWSQLMSNSFSKGIVGKEDTREVGIKTGPDADGNTTPAAKKPGNPNASIDIRVKSAELFDPTTNVRGGL